jgi:hypothetical protein
MLKADAKPKWRPVLSLRAHEDMARDIQAEARKRKLRVSEEIRRRLEFYAAHHGKKPVSRQIANHPAE